MRSLSLALVLVSACGLAQTRSEPTENTLRISEPVLFRGTGLQRSHVADGGVLHSGDVISIEVAANRRAYVYVLQRHDDGSVNVLVPGPNERLVEIAPQELTVLPSPSSKFDMILDNTVGRETLYVVASERALDIVLEGDTPVIANRPDAGVDMMPIETGPPHAGTSEYKMQRKTTTLVKRPSAVGSGNTLIGGYSGGFAKKGVILQPKVHDRFKLEFGAPESTGVIVRPINFYHQ